MSIEPQSYWREVLALTRSRLWSLVIYDLVRELLGLELPAPAGGWVPGRLIAQSDALAGWSGRSSAG